MPWAALRCGNGTRLTGLSVRVVGCAVPIGAPPRLLARAVWTPVQTHRSPTVERNLVEVYRPGSAPRRAGLCITFHDYLARLRVMVFGIYCTGGGVVDDWTDFGISSAFWQHAWRIRASCVDWCQRATLLVSRAA